MSSFSKAFAAARAAADKGGPKTFTYGGKSFSTARADDKPSKGADKPAAKPSPMAPSSSARPKPKPGTTSPMAPSSSARPKANPSATSPMAPSSSGRPQPKPLMAEKLSFGGKSSPASGGPKLSYGSPGKAPTGTGKSGGLRKPTPAAAAAKPAPTPVKASAPPTGTAKSGGLRKPASTTSPVGASAVRAPEPSSPRPKPRPVRASGTPEPYTDAMGNAYKNGGVVKKFGTVTTKDGGQIYQSARARVGNSKFDYNTPEGADKKTAGAMGKASATGFGQYGAKAGAAQVQARNALQRTAKKPMGGK